MTSYPPQSTRLDRTTARARAVLLAAGLLAVSASAATAAGIELQLVTNRANASAGDAGEAIVNVVATKKGVPVEDLGSEPFDDFDGPFPGWSVDAVSVSPGGCNVAIVNSWNQSAGRYSLRVSPAVPGCIWLAGRYVLNVSFLEGKTRGAAIAPLDIP